jgi:hypothetical protein
VATALVRSTTGKLGPFGLAGLTLAAAALTACLGPNLSPTPIPSPIPTASPTSGISAVATSIDPCGLLTVEQASAVNGVPYKGGDAQTLSNGLSVCYWDNAAARATVEVGFSFWPSAAAAQAANDAALASGSPAGWVTSPVAGLANAAAITRLTPTPTPTPNPASSPASVGSDASDNFTGAGNILVRRDTLFLEIGYHNGTTPTDAALEAVATQVLEELPQFAR